MTDITKYIITKLQKSKFFELILTDNNRIDKSDVIAVYIGGSRECNFDDKKSDVDIIVITKRHHNMEPTESLTFNGTHIHWYYIPFNLVSHAVLNNHLYLIIGTMWLSYLSDEVIIYRGNEELITKLLEYKDTISFCGSYELCKELRVSLALANYDEEAYCDNMKMLHYLCHIYYKFLGLDVDWELLNKIKRYPVENNQVCTKILKNLSKYLVDNSDYLRRKYEESLQILNKLIIRP